MWKIKCRFGKIKLIPEWNNNNIPKNIQYAYILFLLNYVYLLFIKTSQV